MFQRALFAVHALPTSRFVSALRPPARLHPFSVFRLVRAASSTMVHSNLLNFRLSAEEIETYTDTIIAKSRQIQDAVAALTVPRTFANTLQPLCDDDAEFDSVASNCEFPSHVSTSETVRSAGVKAAQKLQKFSIESCMREDIYRAVKGYHEHRERMLRDRDPNVEPLTPEQERYVARVLRDFRRSGLDLPEEQRQTVENLKKRLADLCIEFHRNLTEDRTGLSFTKSELEGLPEDFFNQLEKETSNDPNEEVRYKVTMQYTDLFPTMRNAIREKTRYDMDFANGSRCVDVNVPLLEEAVRLRSELASLLGYPHFADYILDIRMAKNYERVCSFLDSLQTRLMGFADAQLDTLRLLKHADNPEVPFAETKIHGWDFQYYQNRLMREKYEFDEESVKVYFPLDTVTRGMFEIYQQILSLRFSEVEDPPNVWHTDVRMFEVFDSNTDRFMGQFFLDLHPRGGKYGHAAVFPLQRCAVYGDGREQRPVVAMVANFTKPTDTVPSLLKHAEVVTYFHEFGHVMHSICSDVKIPCFSGTSTERDFVEAPSQMLENWCWEKQALKIMSGHYLNPDEKVPDEIVDRMVAAKNANCALVYLRQLFFSKFDLTLHTSSEKHDTAELWRKLRKEITLIEQTANTNPAAAFAHIMGGYEAGYYGYLWSEVFSADMFSVFKASGNILSPEIGKRYRETILQPGGSIDGETMIHNFLGREPSQETFLVNLGLIEPTDQTKTTTSA